MALRKRPKRAKVHAMTKGICMKCGATFAYDPFGPARQHVCASAPETPSKNKGAEDAGAKMTPLPPMPKPPFDRKANHKRYMREWRARQTALRRQTQGVRP